MHRNNITPARNVAPAREAVSEETSIALWDLVNGRTLSDDAPEGCDTFDYMLTIDVNLTS